jgi:hypothetical protein
LEQQQQQKNQCQPCPHSLFNKRVFFPVFLQRCTYLYWLDNTNSWSTNKHLWI